MLKKEGWKFSKEKLEEINKWLDGVQVLAFDKKTFNTLIIFT
jgi:hypothetical protein